MSELAKSLCEYQRQTGGFEADKRGNRSQYASIGAVINNVKQANAFGLTFTQEVDFEGDTMFVRTVMMHTSGEARMSRYPIFVDDKTNSQKIGGAITYAKRYALASMFGTEKGVEDTDDDGESNGLLNDAPKEIPPKPAATTPVTVSLSDDAGHSREDGLQPASRAFSSIVETVEPQEDSLVAEVAAVDDLDALKVLFNDMGGKSMPQDKQVIFSNRMKAIMQGANS